MSNNRNPIKQWAVTFSQSGDIEREAYANSFPAYDSCICVREEHKEGGNHLHLGIKLKKAISFTKFRKWVMTKWPNDYHRQKIEATKDVSAWQDYLSKEDPEPFVVEDISARERKMAKLREKYAAILKKRVDEAMFKVCNPGIGALGDELVRLDMYLLDDAKNNRCLDCDVNKLGQCFTCGA